VPQARGRGAEPLLGFDRCPLSGLRKSQQGLSNLPTAHIAPGKINVDHPPAPKISGVLVARGLAPFAQDPYGPVLHRHK